MQYALRLGAQGGDFHYGDNTFKSAMGESATPYVVSQQTGALVGIPEFLNSQHKIETRADCEAYLARLDAFARQLDQETERVRYDMGHGVIAPDFILDTTLTQARGFPRHGRRRNRHGAFARDPRGRQAYRRRLGRRAPSAS